MHAKSDLSAIKQIPIIEVAKQLGIQVRGTKAMCFMGHDKASPSLSFSISRNNWKCFGACGKHGDGINLVMEKEGLDFNAALEWFSNNFNADVKRQFRGQRKRTCSIKPNNAMVAPVQKQSEFFSDPELYTWFVNKCAVVSNPVGVNYLESHGISDDAASRFNLRQMSNPERAFRILLQQWGEDRVFRSGIAWGCDGKPKSLIWGSYALLFPFYDEGKIIYIQARMFEKEPKAKFLNLRGIAKPLFNADRLIGLHAGQTVHLCEGIPDTLSLDSKGLNAVGILGATSFRAEWVDRFLKFKVVVLGDGDEGGVMFAKDISKYFSDRGKQVECMRLPKGKDVSDVLAQNGSVK